MIKRTALIILIGCLAFCWPPASAQTSDGGAKPSLISPLFDVVQNTKAKISFFRETLKNLTEQEALARQKALLLSEEIRQRKLRIQETNADLKNKVSSLSENIKNLQQKSRNEQERYKDIQSTQKERMRTLL